MVRIVALTLCYFTQRQVQRLSQVRRRRTRRWNLHQRTFTSSEWMSTTANRMPVSLPHTHEKSSVEKFLHLGNIFYYFLNYVHTVWIIFTHTELMYSNLSLASAVLNGTTDINHLIIIFIFFKLLLVLLLPYYYYTDSIWLFCGVVVYLVVRWVCNPTIVRSSLLSRLRVAILDKLLVHIQFTDL